MGGVDLSDNLFYHFTTACNKMKKFYKKMFSHFLDMSVLNSYITCKKLGGKMQRVDFIVSMSENIVAKYATRLPIPSTAKPSRLIGKHFPDFWAPTPDQEKLI